MSHALRSGPSTFPLARALVALATLSLACATAIPSGPEPDARASGDGHGGTHGADPTDNSGDMPGAGGEGSVPRPPGKGAGGAAGVAGASSKGGAPGAPGGGAGAGKGGQGSAAGASAGGSSPGPSPGGGTGSTGPGGSGSATGAGAAGGSIASLCQGVASWACDPTTETPCSGGGSACDFSTSGLACYDPPNGLDLGDACSPDGPDFCRQGATCDDGVCKRFCCTSDACGGKACEPRPFAGGVVGVCAGGVGAGGTGTGGTGTGGTGTGGTGTGGTGSVGTGGATGDCYAETYTTASLTDLAQSYGPSKWLSSSLEALKRRHPDGHDLLVQMKGDSQLPDFADPSSWPNLMASVDTMCHEETHGWDFDHALSLSGKHAYRLRADLVLTPPKLAFFPRSELLPYIQDGSTAQYDATYLKGTQGTYDFVFLADELNAYITGLACATAVGDQIGGFGISLRDGAASHLLYLQWYLHRARTAHAGLYAQMKASPEWMKVVRYQWARGHFWTKVAKAYPALGIGDAAIWAHIQEPQNLSEIQQFTGDDPAVVACHP